MSTVLIVDDETPIREILKRWLEPAGYQVSEAGDADTALATTAAVRPDAVLCDIDMPGHDGLWLVAQLREQHPAVAIVLATAVDTVPPTTSLRSGVVAYVLKPLVRDQVLAAVTQAVAWHQAAVAQEAQPGAAGEPIEDWLQGKPNRAG